MRHLLSRLLRKVTDPAITSCETEIHNSGTPPLEVWMEPWGHPVTLLPSKTLTVLATSPEPGSLEVVDDGEIAAIYGWSRCALSIYQDGKLLDELFELPDLGDGPGPRQVVEMLFGGPGGPL